MTNITCLETRFQVLLEELRKEHEKELGTLNQEIQLLKEALDGQLDCQHAGMGDFEDRFSSLRLKGEWLSAGAPPQGQNGDWGDGLEQVLVRDTRSVRQSQTMVQGLNGIFLSMTGDNIIHAIKGIPHLIAHFAISPNSQGKLMWDLTGLLLIAYDVISIPFTQAFDPPKNLLQQTMDWITLIYWTSDLVQSFFSGYYDKGELKMDRRLIAKRYLTTWFLVDFAVVGPEWLMIIFTSGNGGGLARVGRIFRSARAIRVLRLLRLLKLQRIINIVYDMIESEYTFILLNLAKLLLIILILNHVLACCWYLTGRLCMENDQRNWLEVGDRGVDIAAEWLLYKYTTSLHWSLTQFTPASMGVSATNVWERVFSIIVLFFALVAFSSIVGSITSSMTSLRNMRGDEMKQFWLLRRYLRQKGVQQDLKYRILKFLEYKTNSQQKDVQTSNIRILQWMSEPLQNELQHELSHKALMVHPFFRFLQHKLEVVVHRLCQAERPGRPAALGHQPLAAFDVVFHQGDEATKMYFITAGSLGYVTPNHQALDPNPCPGEWAAEAVLWTPWWHRGKLYAISTADMLVLMPDAFIRVIRMHPRPWNTARVYAEHFVETCMVLQPGHLCDIMRDLDQNLAGFLEDLDSRGFYWEKESTSDGLVNGEGSVESPRSPRSPRSVNGVAVRRPQDFKHRLALEDDTSLQKFSQAAGQHPGSSTSRVRL